jgi:hypothetical protein
MHTAASFSTNNLDRYVAYRIQQLSSRRLNANKEAWP